MRLPVSKPVRLLPGATHCCALSAKVNHNSPRIGLEDMSPLHEAGWSDEAIYFAITVCALFKFYNGWIDAAGVHASTARAPRSTATPETRA